MGLGGALITTTSASAVTSEPGEVLVDASTSPTAVEEFDTPAITDGEADAGDDSGADVSTIPVETTERGSCDPAEGEVDCATIELPTLNFVEVSASAVQPTCSAAGSFTLSTTAGVIWMVGNAEIAPGNHPATAGTSVSVEATPYLGGFTENVRTNWTFDFATPAGCDGGIGVAGNPIAPQSPSTAPNAAIAAPVVTELPTLAVTGPRDEAVVIALISLLLTLTGASMIVADRRVEA